MLLFLLKTTAILTVGIIIALCVYRLLPILYRSQYHAFSLRSIDYSAIALLFQNAADILTNAPASKEARRIKLIASVAGFLLSFCLTGKVLFAAMSACGIYYCIGWYAERKRTKQRVLLSDQLVEALGMLTNSVRAGQSIAQALENVSRDTRPPLSVEFEGALLEVKLGMPLSQALITLGNRTDSKDLRMTITAIILAKETGGNLGEILLRLSSTMRERRKIQGKIAALTAQGKASGMVMSAAPFLLLFLLYVMEPDMTGLLFTTLIGNILLALAVGMVAFGGLLIQHIVNIDI